MEFDEVQTFMTDLIGLVNFDMIMKLLMEPTRI